MLQKIKNVMRAGLQGYGTDEMKKTLWNTEFAEGRWDCLESTPDDCIYGFLGRYSREGRILDLGCGSGNTAVELPETTYSRYVGVDISSVAIDKAAVRSREVGRQGKNAFFQSDLEKFAPEGKFDIILLRDSIYYVPSHRMVAMLERYRAALLPGGVFVVRLWGSKKNEVISETIKKHFAMVEEYVQQEPPALVIAFR